MSTFKISTKDLVLSSLMAALVAVMALFPPITLFLSPTPITLQSLGVMLAGCLLGAKRGAFALILFLLLVAIGMPVLAGLVGGAGLFLTPYGGFLLSWPLVAFVIGWLTEKYWQKINFGRLFLINIFGGVVICFLIGIPWMSYFAKTSLVKTAYLSLMFLPGDIAKALIAAWAANVFKKYYPLIDIAPVYDPV